MLDRITKLAHLTAALAVAVFFSVAAYVAWQARSIPLHVNGVLTRAEGVESKLNASAVNLDKATAAWSASAKSQADAVTDLATDARGSLSGVDLTLASLRSNSDALNAELGSLKKTTEAATTLTAQLAVDAGTANETIQKTQPLLEAYTRSGNDLDALLKSKGLRQTIDGLGETSQHIDGVTADFQTRFHDILFPPPCKTFGCRMSRYVWPVVKDGAAFGSTLYWTHALLTNQHP